MVWKHPFVEASVRWEQKQLKPGASRGREEDEQGKPTSILCSLSLPTPLANGANPLEARKIFFFSYKSEQK